MVDSLCIHSSPVCVLCQQELDGDWICEEHPLKPWPHDDCAGPGMPAGNRLGSVVYQQVEEIVRANEDNTHA